MVLCLVCKRIDFRPLLIACLHQCLERQESYYGNGDGTLSQPNSSLWVKQHDDIFELEKLASGCDLCKIIFQAFRKRKVANPEVARGLPIGFRPFRNKIEVSYNVGGKMIELCGLDLYMSTTDGKYLFVEC